jgi:hypothetical protein
VYRIVTDSAVVDQLAALPIDALPGYAEVLDVGRGGHRARL